MTAIERRYRELLASIDENVAGRDQYGGLRWHVECSAEANASDMQAEGTAEKTDDGFYAAAYDTAKMILDDWRSYFPQLQKEPR